MNKTQFQSWYLEEKRRYERLVKYILAEINNALKVSEIEVANTESRVKDISSATDKMQATTTNKEGKLVSKYNDPKNEITDYAGVRIVTFLTSEVNLISELVERMFVVDVDNSTNKIKALGKDRVGYLSVHFVVTLPDEVVDKHEYADLQNLKCEIQIRTVLQHAWAQIFHDRQYKFNSNVNLTDELIRTTNLIAGNLELSDQLITDVVKEYDTLLGNLDNASFNKLLQMSINEETLSVYLRQKLKLNSKLRYFSSKKVLETLGKCKVKTVKHLDNKLQQDFINEFMALPVPMTVDRLVDCILIISDQKLYFNKCFDKNTKSISRETYLFLSRLINVDEICEKYSLSVCE